MDTGKEVSGIARYLITQEKDGFPEKVILEDFIMLDMGTCVSTEFTGEQYAKVLYKWKEEITDNIIIGIIHSHVNMNTDHSSVDIKEVEESTPALSFLISTIFNHKMEFTSKLSYKDRYNFIHINNIESIQIHMANISEDWKEEVKGVVARNKAKVSKIKVWDYTSRSYKYDTEIPVQPINLIQDQQEIDFQQGQDRYDDTDDKFNYNTFLDKIDRLDKACIKITGHLSQKELSKKYFSWIPGEDLQIYQLFSEEDKHKFLASFELYAKNGEDWTETELYREEMIETEKMVTPG